MGIHWHLRKLINRVFYFLTTLRRPAFVVRFAKRKFIQVYRIDLSTAQKKEAEFQSLNEVFTRSLKADLRPIDAGPQVLVSPVDGTVQQMGSIREETLIQAKGLDYTLEKLLASSALAKEFKNGDFITQYLSPSDCHLIFSPYDGEVVSSLQIPGLLYCVREPFVSQVKGLYCVNERVVSFLKTEGGLIGIVKVGAGFVSRITTVYDPEINSDQLFGKFAEQTYDSPVRMCKGEQLATFNFGSTVILLFQEGMIEFLPGLTGRHLSYGQEIGRMKGGRYEKS